MKIKQLLAIRAVRLGIMAVFVATFFGAPALGYMTGNQTLQKLDLVEITADVLGVGDVNTVTAPTLPVDTAGVPLDGNSGANTAQPVQSPDSDNDGIPDSQDRCPNEWGSGSDGCNPDSDGDGIADSSDACPYEAATTSNGCPVKQFDYYDGKGAGHYNGEIGCFPFYDSTGAYYEAYHDQSGKEVRCQTQTQTQTQTTTSSLPDLGISSLTIGSTGKISVNVKNYGTGNVPTNSFGIYIYIDEGQTTSKTWTYSASTLANQGCITAGGTCTISPQVVDMSQSHHVRVVVDPSNVVEESNEKNNESETSYTSSSTQTETVLPDLKAEASVSSTGQVSVNVKNNSDAKISTDSWNVYITVDSKTWTYSVSTLSDKDCLSAYGVCSISPQYVDLNSDHEIKVEVDPTQKITEANENNNTASFYYHTTNTDTASSLPDLALGSVYIDGSGNVIVEVKNTSNVSIDSATNFYIYITIDGKQWTYSTSTLADKNFYSAGGTAQINPQIVSTTEKHEIKVELDPKNTIQEINENNNKFESTIIPSGSDNNNYPTDECTTGSNCYQEPQDNYENNGEGVCGRDGETYASEDEALSAGTEVEYWGKCNVADRRELYEMRKSLSNNNIKFDDIIKRSDRTLSNLDKYIALFSRYQSEAAKRGYDTADFKSIIEDRTNVFEDYKTKVQAIKDEAEEYIALYDDFFAEGEARYALVESGEKGSQYFWNWANKQDFYWKLRETVERKNDPYDDHGIYDIIGREPVKIAFEAAKQNVELNWSIYEEGVYDKVDELDQTWENTEDQLSNLQDDILAVIESEDSLTWDDIDNYRWEFEETMEWIRLDIDDYWQAKQAFWDNEPWKTVDAMWQSVNGARESEFATDKIEKLIATWEEGKVLGTIQDTFTEDTAQSAVADLIKLRDEKLLPAAKQALAKAEELQNPDPIWYFFEQIMKPTDKWARPKIDYLADLYFNKYRVTLSSDQVQILDEFFGGNAKEFNYDLTDGVGDAFGFEGDEKDYFVNAVGEDVLNSAMGNVMGNLSSDVLQSLVEYDKSMGIGLGNFMNLSAHAADPVKLAEYAANLQVLAETLAELRADKNANARLQGVVEKALQYATVLYGDDADAFRNALTAVDAGTITDDELAELESLLEKAIVSSPGAKYRDNLLVFTDTTENAWYYNSVATVKSEGWASGYKDAKGNLTGEYGPGNSVTNGEIIKMILEALGYGPTGSANGHWSDPYYTTAKNLGLNLSSMSNPDSTASRINIADLLNQLMHLQSTGGTYSFTDVPANLSDTVNAIASAGIMTGDDGAGKFRPYDGINRAEAATVITRAYDYMQASQAASLDLNDFNDALDQFEAMDRGGTAAPTDWATGTFQKLGASFLSVLKALRPSILMVGAQF